MRVSRAVLVSLALVSLISASRAWAEVITIRTGQVGDVPGICPGLDASFRFFAPGSHDGEPILPTAFTGSDFDSSCAGPQARVVDRYGPWVATLAHDPAARWINWSQISCLGLPPLSVLYCCPFIVSAACPPENPVADSIRVYWAVDDFLGDPDGQGLNPDGIYINGVSLGSNFRGALPTEKTAVAYNVPILAGTNHLYVYQRDGGGVVSGLMLSATIYVRLPTGACCLPPNGDCVVSTESMCWAAPGAWYVGDCTDCDPNPCPHQEACCLSNGDCLMVVPDVCASSGGVWIGGDCTPDTCLPVPTEGMSWGVLKSRYR